VIAAWGGFSCSLHLERWRGGLPVP
jgi:hypothetical protein